MKTPIYDFLKEYAEGDSVRFHMPGHKGKGPLGVEKYDITEFCGADNLFSPDGIILESENYASELFGTAHSFFSTEGSTLAIKTMLSIVTSGKSGAKILASRGAHKSFLYAMALLGVEPTWLYPENSTHLCSSAVSGLDVESALKENSDVCAVYVTSPDYLGNISDIEGIAKVCKKRGIPLLVDNAHGAYLNFLNPSRHPIALGASMCCDSAHKTLPVLTGGAYLHISKNAPSEYLDSARRMASVFASTSPSYLILGSLDLCNAYLADGYSVKLSDTVKKIDKVKQTLSDFGYTVLGSEPLKIVIDANDYGYSGVEIASHLSKNKIEIEFFDGEYLVLMLTPENSDSDYERLAAVLTALPKKEPIQKNAADLKINAPKVMSVREAVFSKQESVSVNNALGRICASPAVSCPPAVPIVVSGEVITEEAILLFKRYGIKTVEVVKND